MEEIGLKVQTLLDIVTEKRVPKPGAAGLLVNSNNIFWEFMLAGHGDRGGGYSNVDQTECFDGGLYQIRELLK